jgi:WS/DGAT/MGAT family acyltransferase
VSVPLDRSRPLWEIHVVEGLHDGNIALIGKIHHAAVDGVSGAELFVHLFDLTPDAADTGPVSEPTPTSPVAPEHIPSDVELVGHALLSQARRTISLPALVGRTARTISHLVSRHRDPETVVGAVPLRAPRTPWSAAITPHRSVAFARVKLSDLKRVRAAFDVKVNDVVLAVVSGAVRRYLAEREALPDEPLVAMCPVSVRDEDERGMPDNRVSAMFVYLRTDMEEVTSRLRSIAHSTRGAKDDHHAIGAKFLQNWAEHAAPSTFALATRLYSRLNIADRHPPIYNLVVSNVPGPDFPLYLDGARLVATYPMGPIMEGAGLNVTVLSHLDNVDFGFLAGAELVSDVWDMADHVDAAMAELLEAAAAIDGLDPVPPAAPDRDAAPAPAPGEGETPSPVAGDGVADTTADDTTTGSTGVGANGVDAGPLAPADIETNGDTTPPPPPAARASSGKASARQATGKQSTAATPAALTPTAKKPATARPTAKKSAAKKPATVTPTAKKPTTKKPTTKKPATATPTAKKPAAKKPTTVTPTAKKPAAKKPAAKKPTTKPSVAGESTATKSSSTPAAGKSEVEAPTVEESTAKSGANKPSAERPTTGKASAERPAAKASATEKPSAETSTAETVAANGAEAGESPAPPPAPQPAEATSAETVPPPGEAAPDTDTPADDAATDTKVVDLVATTAIPTR